TLPANLVSGSAYRIRVVSSNPVITGGDNGSNLVVKGCARPANLAASNVTKKSATVTWGAVDCATSYRLQYRLASSGPWKTKNTAAPSVVLKNLTANTTYDYKVMTTCSANGASKSKYTAISNFTTLSNRE